MILKLMIPSSHDRSILTKIYAVSLMLISAQFAYADPLSLQEINRFNGWVQCTESCADRHSFSIETSPTYEEQRSRFVCLQACGTPAYAWEKDGARRGTDGILNVYPIDRHDLKLAILEFQSNVRPNSLESDVNSQFRFGMDFDPSQLICYGDVLIDDTQSNTNEASDEGEPTDVNCDELDSLTITDRCELISPSLVLEQSGGQLQVDTRERTDRYQGSCNHSETPDGSEQMIELRLLTASAVSVTLDEADFDAIIYLRSNCEEEEIEANCDYQPNDEENETLSFERLERGQYFIFVEGFNGASGQAELNVEVTPLPNPDCAEDLGELQRATQNGSMVIVGTLCPYNEDSETPKYGCPYLSNTMIETNGLFNPFCDEAACDLETFEFDRPLNAPDAQGSYWQSNYRPFICPDVVCDLVTDESWEGGNIEACYPSEADQHVPVWLQDILTDQGKVLCDLSAFGGGTCALDERCVYDDQFGRGVCQRRCLSGDACTVAHLELKSETDQELIAWVYFDHSDAPVRALDLHFTYPRDQLVLADSRRLPALLYSGGQDGKQLATQHLPDETLRLSVFDTTSSAPIPYGPIIELVFKRVGDGPITIDFTDDPDLRENSMAPNHNQAITALREDQAWGSAINVSPRGQASIQLKLWYDFENIETPLTFGQVHSGEELCELISDCVLEPQESFKERLTKQLDRLQSGQALLDRSISGVLNRAGYFDGNQSHLRLPIVINDRLNRESQSFSFSTWLYTEGLNDNETLSTPQILFAHHDRSERTRFGVWLRYNEQREAYQLEFFDGDLLARDLSSGLDAYLLADVPLYAWQHFSFTYDATQRLLRFYYNGEQLPNTHLFDAAGPSPFTCPQFSRNREIIIQKEGEFLGGTPPQTIYYGVKESGLFKVRKRDLYGTTDQLILGDGEFSYTEPDYSPVLDKVVYTSNASGHNEIWIANGNGSERQQLTVDFGSSDLGFSARAPKWSPDGTGIVFESNAFDVIARDNLSNRVYHLYYVAYDPIENKPSIELPNGDTVEQLNYQERLADQSLVFYRLTQGDNIRHHRKIRWLEGKTQDTEDADNGQRGRILYETSDPLYQGKGIDELLIDEVIPLSSANPLSLINSGELSEEVSLLDAKRYVRITATGAQSVERLLFKRTYTEFNELDHGYLLGSMESVLPNGSTREVSQREETQHKFELNVVSTNSTDKTATIDLIYRPKQSLFDSMCWDKNSNNLRDSDEDITKDNQWDTRDCFLQEVSQLFVELDGNQIQLAANGLVALEPSMIDPPSPNISRSPWNKSVRLSEQNAQGRAFVSLQVTAPRGVYPLYNPADNTLDDNVEPLGLTIARFKIKSRGGVLGDINTWDNTTILDNLGIVQRTAEETLVIRDLNPDEECWDLNQNRIPEPFEDRNGDEAFNSLDCVDQTFNAQGKFELIKEARLSPDLDQILLYVVSLSRPQLLLTDNLYNTDNLVNLSEQSKQYKGFSWRFEERYFPCNWVGAVKHPTQKKLMTALRGGLDELKVHLGVRNIHSIRSEAERGREWLDRSGPVSSQRPRCGVSHLECPPFHLCIESECVVTACDPDATADMNQSCAAYGAQCRLRPVTIESEEVGVGLSGGAEYVCVADCSSNQECYTQTCLNGPCLFCDVNTSSCNECRQVEVNINGATASRTEGCPDERAFYCDTGACRTECYSFEDDQSLYLCDPVTQFCEQGRCVLRDWEWEDLSPLTLMGAADAQFDLSPSEWTHYTIAIGESYPLEINAYGVGDYGAHPEVLVEVRGGPYYGGQYQVLGRLAIPHRTQEEANRSPLVLDSVHPYEDVRLRLITSPYQNVTGSASGLGEFDKDFCITDVTQSGIDLSSISAQALCERRAQGSRYQLGYRLDIPEYESIQSCRDRGHAGCLSRSRSENNHLYGGAAGVAVLDIKSHGGSINNNLTRNTICSYGGGQVPFDLQGRPQKLFFGRVDTERSNQKNDFCEREPTRCLVGVNDSATLNFNGSFALLNCTYTNADQPSESAFAEYTGISHLGPLTESGVIAQDTGDSCLVQVGEDVDVCYEWSGQAVSFDPYTHPITEYQSLELSVSRSFGHDRGFEPVPPPSYIPKVQVSGYSSGIGLVLSNGMGEFINIDRDGLFTFPPMFEGWRYNMSIAQQPLVDGLVCFFVTSPALPTIGTVSDLLISVNFEVTCEQSRLLKGCVNYATNACDPNLVGGPAPSLQLVSGGQTRLTQEVTAYTDAQFSFARGLKESDQYTVSVLSSPPGLSCEISGDASGVIGHEDPPLVIVQCDELPGHQLNYTLSGLSDDETLTLIESESGDSITVTTQDVNAEGVGNFGLDLRQGETFNISIIRQPQSQNCRITQGEGIMPAGGLSIQQGVQIGCTSLETFEVSVPVMGLPIGATVNATLVSLIAQTETRTEASYSMPTQAQTNPPAAMVTFSRTLFNAQSFRIEVEEDNANEAVSCEVRHLLDADSVNDPAYYESYNNISGVPYIIQCEDTNQVDPIFTLSGTVINGADLSGIKVSVNTSPNLYEIPAGATEFTLPDRLPVDSPYIVSVEIAPEYSTCYVANPEGRITDDVVNLEIRCQLGTKVQLSLDVNQLPGRSVKAELYSSTVGNISGRLIGKMNGELPTDNTVLVKDLENTEGSSSEPVYLSPGTYHLYTYINANNSYDRTSNQPTYKAGDIGRYRTLTITDDDAGTVRSEAFTYSNFLPLQPVAVFGQVPGVDGSPSDEQADDSMICIFSPPNTFVNQQRVPIPSPNQTNSPIVGKVSRTCTEECELDSFTYVTNNNTFLINGIYDVSCFVDLNETNAQDPGDFVGTAQVNAIMGIVVILGGSSE